MVSYFLTWGPCPNNVNLSNS